MRFRNIPYPQVDRPDCMFAPERRQHGLIGIYLHEYHDSAGANDILARHKFKHGIFNYRSHAWRYHLLGTSTNHHRPTLRAIHASYVLFRQSGGHSSVAGRAVQVAEPRDRREDLQ